MSMWLCHLITKKSLFIAFMLRSCNWHVTYEYKMLETYLLVFEGSSTVTETTFLLENGADNYTNGMLTSYANSTDAM